MPCSPEQLAANRRNARSSTGPRTPEGKAISRQNGLKHGLTGAGVVLPDEDAAEVEARSGAFEVDLGARNDVGRFMARRAAVLSVRLDRCAREEAARIGMDMLAAEADEAEARAAELASAIALLAERPAEAVRKLRRTPEGLDWLIQSWRSLGRDLAAILSRCWDFELAVRLMGGSTGDSTGAPSRLVALTRAARGRLEWLGPADWPALAAEARQAAALDELVRMVEGRIAELIEARDSLDHETIARVRAGAGARAIFDPSREATLARRYEAAASREFFQTLKAIERINAAADGDRTTQGDAMTCGDLGSSSQGPVGAVDRPARRTQAVRRQVPKALQTGPVGTSGVEIMPGIESTRPTVASSLPDTAPRGTRNGTE